MKTSNKTYIIAITSIAVMASLGCSFSSNEQLSPMSHAILSGYDNTGSHEHHINIDELDIFVSSKIGFNTNSRDIFADEVRLRFMSIDCRLAAYPIDVKIPPVYSPDINALNRADTVNAALSKAKEVAQSIIDLDNNNCTEFYPSAVISLGWLVSLEADEKTAVFFTDAIDQRYYQYVKNNPNKSIEEITPELRQIFSEFDELPNLEGIEIVFVYNYSEDTSQVTAYKMLKFFKQMMEEKGAVVKIQQTLT